MLTVIQTEVTLRSFEGMERDLRVMFSNEAIDSFKDLLQPFYSTHWNKSFSPSEDSEELYIQQSEKAKKKLFVLWTRYSTLAKLEAEGNEDALANFKFRLKDVEEFERNCRAMGWPEELLEAVTEGLRRILVKRGEILKGGGQFLDNCYAPIPRPQVDVKDSIGNKWGELTLAYLEHGKKLHGRKHLRDYGLSGSVFSTIDLGKLSKV